MNTLIRRATTKLAVGLAACSCLCVVAPSVAQAATGTPVAGANCQYQDGKISGRGSTDQTWLQFDLMAGYAADVCGSAAPQTVVYTGPGGTGSITFTVTDDGTFVNSYFVLGIHGTASNGSGCTVDGSGDPGEWVGAQITDGSFSYTLGTSIVFQGTVTGASATGTFQFDSPAQGASLGCNTGVVNWTATVTSTPPAGSDDGDVTHPLSPIYGLVGGGTFDGNWMTAYNYPAAQVIGAAGVDAAIGPQAGLAAIGCFAEAFAGSDLPATGVQLTNIDDGTYTNVGGSGGDEQNGMFCNPSSASEGGLVSPFTPALPYPNAGDSTGLSPAGVMVFPVGVSAVANFANLPTGCVPAGGLHLTNAQEENIWGGAYANWDQVAGIVGSCAAAPGLAITRVARSDDTGTTQAMDDYLADISDDGSAGICSSNANSGAASWELVQNAQVVGGTNVNWPSGGDCSTLADSQGAGAQALLTAVESASGAIGYASLPDVENDSNDFQSQVSGNTVTEFTVQASNSATNFQSPSSKTGASDCAPTDALPGDGSPNGAVGIASGGWDLTAESIPNGGPDDIGYAREGASYPICSLTWDLVWTGDDGDVANGETPSPDNLNAVAANATSIQLDAGAIAGVPNSFTSGATSGSITVPATGGTDTLSYTGFSAGTDTLTGVSGVTYPIPAGTSFVYPDGTGGPEANLTADQRRDLYSYFIYIESPAAQATVASAGYAPLPASLVAAVRAGLEANF